jgi:hypothetical protein
MARKCEGSLLKEFTQFTKNTEIPSIYSLWCAISTVSAALGRDSFVDMGHYTVYPNLYIVLVAGSGKCKKSTSIGVAEMFLKKIEPPVRLFSQKATPEALIGALSGMKCDEEENTVQQSAEGIIVADELSTLIDKSSIQSAMIPFLTTLWDSKDSFTYETRSRGKETIANACVSLLGGSTIDWIKEAISLTAIGGGFTARIIFVYRDTYEQLIFRTTVSDENKRRKKRIIHDINEIAAMRGAFMPTDEAWELMDKEYKHFMMNSPLHDNKYLSGYANKRSTNLLKLCMVISASKRDSKVITIEDADMGLRILENVEQYMPKVMMAIAADETGVATAYVTEIIQTKGEVSRKALLNMVHHRMQAQDLDSILETLDQAGVISRNISGKKCIIRLVGDEATQQEQKKQDLSFTDMILKGVKR